MKYAILLNFNVCFMLEIIFLDQISGRIYSNNRRRTMNKTKIAITVDQQTVKRIDRLVRKEAFPDRSKALNTKITKVKIHGI